MPKIIKKIGFNVIGLLLLFGFHNNIIKTLDVEKIFILDDSKPLIVSIVLSLLILLYYMPVLLFEKVSNTNRLWTIANIVIIYYGFTEIASVPSLKYPFPIHILIVSEALCWTKLNKTAIPLIEFLVVILILQEHCAIPFCIVFAIALIEFSSQKQETAQINSKLLIEQNKDIYGGEGNADKYNRRHTIKATVDNTSDFFSDDKSTALAITGEWGSGKTAFKYEMQNQIKNSLNEDYIMFDFDAWACDSPHNIIKSFFTQYRKHISKYIPKLNPVIKDYMFELLDNLGDAAFKVKHISKYVKELIGSDSEDNFDYITSYLQKAQIRSYIFIDDLDRMQSDEIQEVLKLVRNTANFPYTQFILFYDKEYIIETLSGKLKNANLYLEKIINVEIPLSKIESPTLVLSFWNKIEKDIKEYDKKVLQKTDSEKIDNDISSINKILEKTLKNEREVLQLCNKIKIVLDYYKYERIPVSYCDLIWICLINNKYFKLYEIIASNPDLLGMRNPFAPGSNTKLDISNDVDFTPETVESNTEELSTLAQKLYPNDEIVKNLTQYKLGHIIESDNKYRYFSFGYSQKEFTVSDIKNNIQSELKHNVTLWTLDNRYKSNISLYKNYPTAINELLLELSDEDFKKLRENIFHSLRGDEQILSGDYETPTETIELYKDLFREYVKKWDYNTDVKNYDVLFSRQLNLISDSIDIIDKETAKEFIVKLLVNFQKRLDDESFNVDDFNENEELANLYDCIKEEIRNFLPQIDVSILKECIELVDSYQSFKHSIIPKDELLKLIQ